MRILIAAAGSHGDVAPYTGLGARLRAAGHEVALTTHESFAPLVRGAGLGFRPLPADARASGPAAGRRELMRAAAVFVRDLGAGLADAVDDRDDLLVLSTTTAPPGWQLAEALDVPTLGAYLQPTHPTGSSPRS